MCAPVITEPYTTAFLSLHVERDVFMANFLNLELLAGFTVPVVVWKGFL